MLLRSLALSLVPFSVACAVTAPSSEGTNGGPVSPASSPRPRGLPPVQAPLYIQGSAEGASMAEVMDRFAKLSGQHLSVNDFTRQRLEAHRIRLREDVTVPEDEVYSFIEAALIEAGLYIAPVKGGEVPILGIYSLQRESIGTAEPLHVEQGDVAAYAEHPALLISTMIQLPNSDTRTLQTQLRVKITDTQVQSMICAGRHNLILTGAGSFVAGLVESLLEIDEANALGN